MALVVILTHDVVDYEGIYVEGDEMDTDNRYETNGDIERVVTSRTFCHERRCRCLHPL